MAITYNMKGECFNVDGKIKKQKGDKEGMELMDDLFQKDNVHHDMYVFGTQEAERSITMSLFN